MILKPNQFLLLALALLPGCTAVRKVENMIPEVPEILLIGEKKERKPEALDPFSMTPDLAKDAAVFKINVQGQTRRFVIQLYPNAAPITVANFQRLVRADHYEGMAFHRLIPNYLVQTGDPQSKDQSSRAAWGTGGIDSTLPPEISLPHRLGAVGMARLGDATNPRRLSSVSQFYITLGNLKKLNGQYTIFGQIIQGYDVLQDLSELAADENDNPYRRIEITSVKLDRASQFTPEDPATLQRKTRRKPATQIPTQTEGPLKRAWRRIW